ncbi:MAG: two-component regulator propeller domain-containing protein [Bacteroidia bacterium]
MNRYLQSIVRCGCFVAALVLAGGLPAQEQTLPLGTWRSYLNHSLTVGTVEKDGIVYTITTGGMFSYEAATGEVRTYSTVDGLSGINPSSIYYAHLTGRIYIGYNDGQIDYFTDPAAGIFSYTDIRRNTFFTDKRINAFAADDSRLYVATNFGLVIYDQASGLPLTDVSQFADNPSRTAASGVALHAGEVYVLLQDQGLYHAPVDFPNLKDPSIWLRETDDTGLPVGISILSIGARTGQLYLLSDQTVFLKENDTWRVFEPLDFAWFRLFVSEKGVGAARIDRVTMVNAQGGRYEFFLTGDIRNGVVLGDAEFYLGARFRGLYRFNNWDISRITPDGPASNDCVEVVAGHGEVYVAPKGYNQAYGPDVNTLGVFHYQTRSGVWNQLNLASQQLPEAVSTGFARASYDPQTRTAYLGSWGQGLVTLQDGVLQDYYDCQNVDLPTITGACDPGNKGNTRVSGMDFDPYGNLWVSFDFALPPLAVRTPGGDWREVPLSKFPADHHIVRMITDDYGSVWMIHLGKGLLVYTANNTPENFTDGRMISLRSGPGQGDLPTNDVFALAKDQDGFIWVGTGQGVVVFYDAFSISQGSIVDAAPPVFEGSALLENTVVTAIAVDGGNRKWIGTEDGLFLVSENGDKLIHQFNTENSPLLANKINDIAIDQQTGEVFVATELGLISFQGDATEGERGCDNLRVYPNPVLPDYQGTVTIRGSASESTVRITTVSGLLVRELTAEGGTAVWDGRDLYGRRVRSGIYLALVANRNGEDACIAKFSVISR